MGQAQVDPGPVQRLRTSDGECGNEQCPGATTARLPHGFANGDCVIAFRVSDMTSARCAGAVTRALKAVDRAARVQVDLATFTVEIESGSATARELSDAIHRAGYSPVAA